MKSKIIAILNQKGGVGKTTTAISIGAYLAKKGKKILVVDFDPQGNATSGLGVEDKSLMATLADAIDGHKKAEEVIYKTDLYNLFIMPGNARLASSEVELAGAQEREFALKNILSGLQYDFMLIDCPPSLGLLTVNALVASDSVLVPVQAEFYALEGLSQLLQVMQQIRSRLNPDLELMGVLLTMFDKRNSLSGEVYNELSSDFGEKLFQAVIPRNVRLAEAPSYGKPISEYDKWSKGARAYKKAAQEVVKRSEGYE